MWFFAVFFLSLTTKHAGALGVGCIGLDKSTHGNTTPEKTALHTGIGIQKLGAQLQGRYIHTYAFAFLL
jgi:hypothetical protein